MRRNLLNANRLIGDLDLGLENTRIDPGAAKRWAMMDTPGGRVDGGSYQDIASISDSQNYRIGTRRVVDDRVYRYCLNGVSELRGGYGAYAPCTDTEYGTLALDHAAGVTTITITSVAGFAANAYAEGYLVVNNPPQIYKIKSNEAATGGAEQIAFVIYEPLKHAITNATETVNVFQGIYNAVLAPRIILAAAGYGGVVCVPNRTVTLSYYFWGQTWGPCMVTPAAAYGATQNARMMGFWQDGSVGDHVGPANDSQLGGFLLPLTYVGGVHNVNGLAQMIMLQISP